MHRAEGGYFRAIGQRGVREPLGHEGVEGAAIIPQAGFRGARDLGAAAAVQLDSEDSLGAVLQASRWLAGGPRTAGRTHRRQDRAGIFDGGEPSHSLGGDAGPDLDVEILARREVDAHALSCGGPWRRRHPRGQRQEGAVDEQASGVPARAMLHPGQGTVRLCFDGVHLDQQRHGVGIDAGRPGQAVDQAVGDALVEAWVVDGHDRPGLWATQRVGPWAAGPQLHDQRVHCGVGIVGGLAAGQDRRPVRTQAKDADLRLLGRRRFGNAVFRVVALGIADPAGHPDRQPAGVWIEHHMGQTSDRSPTENGQGV